MARMAETSPISWKRRHDLVSAPTSLHPKIPSFTHTYTLLNPGCTRDTRQVGGNSQNVRINRRNWVAKTVSLPVGNLPFQEFGSTDHRKKVRTRGEKYIYIWSLHREEWKQAVSRSINSIAYYNFGDWNLLGGVITLSSKLTFHI